MYPSYPPATATTTPHACSNNHILLHILLSLLLDILIEGRLQEAGVANAVVVLASHALVRRLLNLCINAAALGLLHGGAEALFHIRLRY